MVLGMMLSVLFITTERFMSNVSYIKIKERALTTTEHTGDQAQPLIY